MTTAGFSGKVRIGVLGQAGPLLDLQWSQPGSETTLAAPSDKLTQAGGDPSALTLGASEMGTVLISELWTPYCLVINATAWLLVATQSDF